MVVLLAVLLAGTEQPASSSAAVTPTWMSIDEFGRNTWRILALAVLYSFGKGLAITATVAFIAAAVAYLASRRDRQWTTLALRAVCAVVESVPLVLWIAIVVVSVKGPRLWITLVAFGVLVLPSVTQIFLGEFTRMRTAPFVEAAYLLGISEARVFARYLLPAALPVLVPVLIQVLGSAIAIDGAIGVLGLGNRSDIDLGVFLLRGKEQFVTRPELMISALLSYGALYAYLEWLARVFGAAVARARQPAAPR
jgi:peptide/nickel transport system permease protein